MAVTFLHFPPELMSAVFCAVDDIPTLEAAMAAHPRIQEVIIEHQMIIATSVIINEVGTGIFPPLLYTFRTPVEPEPEHLDMHLEISFLHETASWTFQKRSEWENKARVSLTDATLISDLWKVIKSRSERFHHTTRDVYESPFPTYPWDLRMDLGIYPLTDSERLRIQRAFCLHEAFSKLFGRGPYTYNHFHLIRDVHAYENIVNWQTALPIIELHQFLSVDRYRQMNFRLASLEDDLLPNEVPMADLDFENACISMYKDTEAGPESTCRLHVE
ncbi:hypothetical protein ACHAQA_006776 [Verticillium albo-atrum]